MTHICGPRSCRGATSDNNLKETSAELRGKLATKLAANAQNANPRLVGGPRDLLKPAYERRSEARGTPYMDRLRTSGESRIRKKAGSEDKRLVAGIGSIKRKNAEQEKRVFQ
jgi:hypothetical protein